MKKLILPLITLIIGFIAGYYFNRTSATAAHTGGYGSKHSISREEAQMLVDTFGIYGLQDANHVPGGKGEKTRSSFIPLKDLDSLVAGLDEQRRLNGKTDGIRIYFGRYPKFQPDGKTRYEMAYHNTIILVATKDTMIMPKRGKNPIRIHIDYFGSGDSKKVLGLYGLDVQNRTDLCPDNCDGGLLVCPDPNDTTCNGNGSY
jgi:hypothetical protein